MSRKIKIALTLDPELIEFANRESRRLLGLANKSAYINLLLRREFSEQDRGTREDRSVFNVEFPYANKRNAEKD